MTRRRPPPSEEESELAARSPASRPLGPAIASYLQDRGLGAITAFRVVLEAWARIVGEEVAEHCRPRRVDGDELVVDTDQAAWSTELAFRSREILERLAKEPGAPQLRHVKVHVRTGFGVD